MNVALAAKYRMIILQAVFHCGHHIPTFQGNIFQSPISGTGKLVNTSTADQSAIIAFGELAWNMTGRYKDRGRYLEELAFSVRQLPSTSQEVEYQWTVGYRAPKVTTYASDVSYSVVVAALVVPQDWVQVHVFRFGTCVIGLMDFNYYSTNGLVL